MMTQVYFDFESVSTGRVVPFKHSIPSILCFPSLDWLSNSSSLFGLYLEAFIVKPMRYRFWMDFINCSLLEAFLECNKKSMKFYYLHHYYLCAKYSMFGADTDGWMERCHFFVASPSRHFKELWKYFPNNLVCQVSKLELEVGDFHICKAPPSLSVLFQSSLWHLRFVLRAHTWLFLTLF